MAYEIKIETGSSVQSVEELKKQIDALRASLDGLNKSTEEYAKIAKQLAEAQKNLANAQKSTSSAMKEIGASTKTAQDNIKKTGESTKTAVDNFKIMRDEIKQLRSDFAGTTAGTQEYDEALLALSNKMRDFNDMNKMIRASAADTGQILGNITGTAKGIAGGFEAASGALEMFGISTDKLQAVEKRTMAIIKIVQGLAAAEDGLTKKLPNLIRQYQAMNTTIAASVKTRTASKAATDAETASDVAQATASKTAAKAELEQAAGAGVLATSETAATGATITLTGAVKALGAAIKSNPLGLILTAVAALISLIPLLITGFKKLFGNEGAQNKIKEDLEAVNTQLDEIKRKEEIQIKIALVKAGDLDPLQEQMLKISLLEKELVKLQTEYDKTVASYKETINNATGSIRKGLEQALTDYKSKWEPILAGLREDLKGLRDELPLKEAERDAEKEKETQKAAEERAKAAAAAYKSRVSELKNFLKQLIKTSKSERQIEDESYEESKKNLKESLDKKLISQKEYAALLLQLQKNHAKNLKDIEEKSLADSKKLSKELTDWANKELSKANPTGNENNRYQQEQADLEKNLKKQLKLYENFYNAGDITQEAYLKKRQEAYDQYYKDVENSTNRHLQNMDKLNAQEANTKVSNINDKNSNLRNEVSSQYDLLSAMSKNDIEAADIAMQKENALFELKKNNLEEQIRIYKELLETQLVGSEEYQKTLETINGLESQLTVAYNEHKTAVVNGEEALKQTQDKIEQERKTYISAVNDIVDKISDLIGMYADEAKERADNEKLSIEARERALEESKKMQIAQIIISTLQGIVSSWVAAQQVPGAPYGPIAYGTMMTGLLTATAAANIAKIQSQQLGGNAGSLSGSASANISVPTYGGPEDNINVYRPIMDDVKVVVLESDITEKQDVNKVRVEESTF